MPGRAVAIVNPATGRGSATRLAERMRAIARLRGVTLDVVVTEHPGHAVELARRASQHADMLIAVGGDGTVSDVITGAVGSHVPIGIIPSGSTNMVAKDLRIPRNVERAAKIALGDGRPLSLDVARVARTTCVHIAGAGYDAEIMRRVSTRAKRRFGWLAYLPPAVRQLRYPAFGLRLVVDGIAYRGRARLVLFAIGGSFIHRRLRVGEGIDRADGQVDVCIFNPPSIAATVSCIGWILLGRPRRSRWQRQVRGKRMRIETNPPVAMEVDGDYIGDTPVDIEILESPARVIVPRRGAG